MTETYFWYELRFYQVDSCFYIFLDFSDGVRVAAVCGFDLYEFKKSTNFCNALILLELDSKPCFITVLIYPSACPFELWSYVAVWI